MFFFYLMSEFWMCKCVFVFLYFFLCSFSTKYVQIFIKLDKEERFHL